MDESMGRDRPRLIDGISLIPVAFVGVFFAHPVVTVLRRGLGSGASETFADLLGSGRVRSAIWFTFWQALASTVLTLVVALPAAAAITHLGPRGQRRARALVTVPFVLPTVVVAGAFADLFRRAGLDEGSPQAGHTVGAVLIAHVFFNYAVVVRGVGSFWAGLDRRVEDQARVLGAGPLRTFVSVTLPRLRPAIGAAAAIVFLFCFTSFGTILILGGPRRATIETEIYRFAVTRADFSTAAALAVIQLMTVVTLVALTTALERRRPATSGIVRRSRTRRGRGALWANGAVAGLVLGTPILLLVERSFSTGHGYGFAHYRALGTRVPQLPVPATTALVHSIVFAAVATALAVLVGSLAALVVVHGRRSTSRLVDLGLTVPLGTSAVTIGFGVLLAFDRPPLDLRTSWWIVPITHSLVGIPFVVRTMVPVLRRIDPALRESAALLGASPGRVRRDRHADRAARSARRGGLRARGARSASSGPPFLPRRLREHDGAARGLPAPGRSPASSCGAGDGPRGHPDGARRGHGGADRADPRHGRGTSD
ncbi:MAG: iron ABC transporter permease [Acidimicrobiales bacterium]